MPNQRIQGPEGFIDFPDTMSRDQITQAMQKLYPPKRGPELQLPSGPASPQLPALQRPLGPIPGATSDSYEPSTWSRIADTASKLPLVNTQTPYGISRGVGAGDALGLGGYSKIAQGVGEVASARELNPMHPIRPLAEGTAHAASGLFEAATPLMIAGGLEAPVAMATGLGGSIVGGEAGSRAAKAAGASPEAQEFWGVAGSAAGGLTSGLGSWLRGEARVEPTKIESVKGETHAAPIREAAKIETPKTPEARIEAPKPAPVEAAPSSPTPGSADYEALRRKVARLESTKTVESPEFAAGEKPDYLKRKLTLTGTGQTMVDRSPYPDAPTMANRHMQRYQIAMNDVAKLKEAGADPVRIDQVKTEGLRALTTWGQYATREDVDATLASLRTNLDEKGAQLARARNVTNDLIQGKLSFSGLKPGADQISRAEFTKIAGHELPTIPKGFVDTLPQDIQQFIEGAKPKDAKEMIVRQWGAKYLTDRMLSVMDEHTKTSEVAAAIAKGKQIDPSTISRYMVLSKEGVKPPKPEVPIEEKAFNYARSATQAGVKLYGKGNFKITEKAGKFRVERLDNQTSAQPEVRGAAEKPTPRESPEPVQAAEATKGPGEPVPPAERSPIEPLPPLQKLEGAMRVTDPAAMETIDKDMERRGLASPGQNLGRRIEDRAANPVLSEDVKAAQPTPEQGLADSTLYNDLVQNYMKKGMAKGTAETMARNKIEREKGAFNMWNKTAGAVSGTNHIVGNILQTLGGSITPEGQQGRNIMRSVFGERARSIDQLYTKFHEVMMSHEGDSIQDLIRFNNAAERKPGSTFLNAQDQAVADSFQDIYQNILWPTLQQINPDKFGPGIENYFGRLFKGKNGQLTAQSMILSKQPFEGGKAFTRSRVNDWIDESIGHGAEPVTNNPVKMQMLVMNQIVKYISAHKAFEEFKDKSLVQWAKVGATRPQGWRMIDDSIFKPRVPGQGGLVEYGNYWAHPDIAKIFNRWMKPGLRGNAIYDPLRNLADTQNMIQLGFSGFHFTFTSVAGAATSDVALGLQQMFNYGKPMKGFGSMMKGLSIVPSSIDTYRLGNMMREEWTVPGTYPFLGKYADLMEDVGGGIGSQNLLQEGQRTAAFKKAFKDGDVVSSLKTGLPALAEFSSKWLMQNYVPNLKMGAFTKMAMEQYDSLLSKGASPDQIRTEVGRTWDSVDNRFGLLRYDNRFWNKTARDLAQLTVRSVGWNWGTLSELFGGTLDVGKFGVGKAAQALGGKPTDLSAKAAYVMALPMVVGTMGAIMHYGMTGAAPQKLEDYFYPGPEGAKISLPGYHKEAFSAIRSLNQSERQGDSFLNKIHPLMQQTYEMWTNQDYYGTEIRHKGDTPVQQAAELGKYLTLHNIPLPFQSGLQQYDKSAGDWRSTAEHFAAGEAGFFPAPKWVGQTKAEQETFDYAKRQWAIGPRTTAEFTRRQTMYQLRYQMDHGKFDGEGLGRALATGRITGDDAMKLIDESEDHLSPFQREFKSIPLTNQLDILSKYAKPEEKAQLFPLLKLDTLPKLLPEQQEEAERKLEELGK
jgi:hypothetical protein